MGTTYKSPNWSKLHLEELSRIKKAWAESYGRLEARRKISEKKTSNLEEEEHQGS